MPEGWVFRCGECRAFETIDAATFEEHFKACTGDPGPWLPACDVWGCDRPPDPAGSAFCLFHAEEYEREERARHEEYWND